MEVEVETTLGFPEEPKVEVNSPPLSPRNSDDDDETEPDDSDDGEEEEGGAVASGPPLKKGPWTPDEDKRLRTYVEANGEGNWNHVQRNAGLNRCGKSCRLRWASHLRPHLKKGPFSKEEEQKIIELHAMHGNKWARMASAVKIWKAANHVKQESGKKTLSTKMQKSTPVVSAKVVPPPEEAGKKAEKQTLPRKDKSRKESAKKHVTKALVANNGSKKANEETSDFEEEDEISAKTREKDSEQMKPGSFQKPRFSFSVLIQGFDPSLPVEQLRSFLKEHFAKCGKVTGVSVSAIEGKAYVSFVDVSSVTKAICLGGSDLGGYNLYVAETDLQGCFGGSSGRFDRSGGQDGGRFGRSEGRDGGVAD